MGLPLAVDEVVIEREAPRRKVWETVGTPRLAVIGPHGMGFEVEPGATSVLRTFIDYDLPGPPWRWLGILFADTYARWCTRTIAEDAQRHFAARPS